MTDNHPITPPLKLFREWTEYRGTECEDQFWWRIATQAARWGADQELEACCEWVRTTNFIDLDGHDSLRAARRPKPPSLKERALSEVAGAVAGGNITPERGALIRLALEQLDD